jgi:hypothetical protein
MVAERGARYRAIDRSTFGGHGLDGLCAILSVSISRVMSDAGELLSGHHQRIQLNLQS